MSKKVEERKYTAEDMDKKTAIEHVRLYPSMYFGGKGASGVFQSVKEIVSNSTDEALAGHGNLIEVTLLSPTKVSVRDYGRGIPAGLNTKYGETGIEMAMQLNSGGKYDKKNYNSSGGMHGVGLSVTNCLSTKMSVTVWQDGKIHYAEFSRGHKIMPKEKGKLKILGDCPKTLTGTEVVWELDPEIMTVVEFDAASIIDLMRTNSFVNSKVAYRFIDKRNANEEPKVYEFLSENGLVDFIDYLRGDRAKIIDKDITFRGLMSDEDEFEISFSYIQDYKSEVHLYVNRNLIPNGGTAVLGFRTGLSKAINDAAKELGILKDKDKPFTTSDIDEGLVAVINLSMKYPELDGQTKNKLMNASTRSDLYNSTATMISAYLEENVIDLGKITQKILLGRKAREASQRARDIVLKETTDKLAGPSKLRDCLSKKASDCEIYLVEGKVALIKDI